MKTKVVLIAILILLSMPVAVGIITAEQKELKSEISLEAYIESEPRIMIRTNKLHYDIGENVEITYTNVGGAVAGFVVGTARPVIPRIIEADTGNVLFLTDPNDCHPCVMMYGVFSDDNAMLYAVSTGGTTTWISNEAGDSKTTPSDDSDGMRFVYGVFNDE